MLKTLHIENYALIRESDIQFASGFVAITGETGAGKSILLGALGLLLGQRADATVLADKTKKCIVEAQFDVSGLGLESIFADADVDYDDRLILRREIQPSAKSRAFANDTPVQLPFLKALGTRIIDIHSQHQTLTLGDSTFRLSLLDTMAATNDITLYREAYQRYLTLKRELEALTAEETQNRKDVDYLQFQFNEISDANLVVNEQEQLEQEAQLLMHAEAVREGLSTASITLDNDDEQAVLSALRTAKNRLQHIEPFHPDIKALLERLDSSLIELDDINSELQHLAEGIFFSPERQQQVNERLALIYRLEQKHSVATIAELIAIRDDLDTRLQNISSLDDRIKILVEKVDEAFKQVQHLADALTKSRHKAASRLEEGILPTLHGLGMPMARFNVELSHMATYGPMGHDAVSLLFNANKGGEMRDLSKVASGGEMSRLMLAIKSTLTSCSVLPTIIFDEIDTGVSGDISVAVGGIMCRMAERMQVIAITHLPQIAARVGQHLKVYKSVNDDRTVSHIRQLDAADRVNEIAVMLSSDPPTKAAIQTARELMQ